MIETVSVKSILALGQENEFMEVSSSLIFLWFYFLHFLLCNSVLNLMFPVHDGWLSLIGPVLGLRGEVGVLPIHRVSMARNLHKATKQLDQLFVIILFYFIFYLSAFLFLFKDWLIVDPIRRSVCHEAEVLRSSCRLHYQRWHLVTGRFSSERMFCQAASANSSIHFPQIRWWLWVTIFLVGAWALSTLKCLWESYMAAEGFLVKWTLTDTPFPQ